MGFTTPKNVKLSWVRARNQARKPTAQRHTNLLDIVDDCQGDRERKVSLSSFFYFLITGGFSIFRLVYSLPFMLLGLLFYVLALVTIFIKQNCQNSDVDLKFLPYGLGLIFLLVGVTVGGSSGLSRGHVKGSRWNFGVNAQTETVVKGAPVDPCYYTNLNKISGLLGNVNDENFIPGQQHFIVDPELQLKFIIPGKGKSQPGMWRKTKKGDSYWHAGCGGPVVVGYCSNIECFAPHFGKNQCKRPECPRCYEWWRANRTQRAVNRLLHDNSLQVHRKMRLSHFVVSPPSSSYPNTKAELKVLVKDAYALMKSRGIFGGLVIVHPFRIHEWAKKKARSEDPGNSDKLKMWRWVRNQPDWERYVYYSPHFHCLGFYKYVKPNVEFKGKTDEFPGWILKAVVKKEADGKKRATNYLKKSPDNLSRTVSYLLSHACVLTYSDEDLDNDGKSKNFESIRWFGTCAKNVLKTPEPEPEPMSNSASMSVSDHPESLGPCKDCGAEVYKRKYWKTLFFDDLLTGALGDPQHGDLVIELEAGGKPPPTAMDYLIERDGD